MKRFFTRAVAAAGVSAVALAAVGGQPAGAAPSVVTVEKSKRGHITNWVYGTDGDDVIHVRQVGAWRFVDADGAPVAAGRGCELDPSKPIPTVKCRSGSFNVLANAGDDHVTIMGRFNRYNYIEGFAGDDHMIGSSTADKFYGSGGNDTVDYRDRPAGSVTADADGEADDGARGEHDIILPTVENILLP